MSMDRHVIKVFMLLRHLLLVSIGLLINVLANAQARVDYNWWDPAANSFPVIEGQAWTGKSRRLMTGYPPGQKKP